MQKNGFHPTPNLEKTVVGAYHTIEDAVVGTYRKVEAGAVGAYRKVEQAFVKAFLTPEEGPEGEPQPSDAPPRPSGDRRGPWEGP